MKSDDEQLSGVASAEAVREMLSACGVRELPACKRAGIATSTILRWKRGSCPKSGQLDTLKRAILEVANDQSTLPHEYAAELDRLRQSVELPNIPTEVDLKKRVDRLERVVVEQLGGQL